MKKKQKEIKKFDSKEIKQSAFVNEDYQKVKAFIIILIIVLILLGLLYFLNGKYVTKDEFQDNKTTTTTTEVSYDDTVITVDKMFKIKEDKYMVLLFDKSDKKEEVLYNNLVLYYKGSTPIYSVDLSNKMNSKYFNLNKEENKLPTSPSEVNVHGARLIIFEKGKVTSYISDKDEIVKKVTAK